MKIVLMKREGYVERVYTDSRDGLEVVELDLSAEEEAVRLPGKGWTDVSLCDVTVTVNRKFVEHVFDDVGRNEELTRRVS